METLLDKIGTKLLQNKKEETVHTLDRVAIVQDALERYELKRKEVNEPWDYHKLVGFVLTALKEKGLNERSDMVGCLISKALLIPNKESYKSLSEQTINQIKSDGVFERRGWVSPELVTKELKERTWGERADKLSNLIPEVQEVEERKEEERLSFADTVGDKVKKWEDLKNQVVSKTSWVKEGLRNMFQMRGWNLPDKEEEILTSKNVYHKVVGFVHEFLSNYEVPGIVDIKVDRLRNAAYEDNSVDRKLSSADIILGLLFQTMSGVKINAEMIVPVRKGEFVEPSTFFIEGNSRIIAQSTFDDIAKKGRIKRQPFKNPEDIVSPDILKKYQQLELPFMSTGLYSASKEIMDKTAGRLMTRKSSYTPIDKDELIKELEDLSLEVELKGHDYQINAITDLAQKLKNNPIRTETGLWNSDEIEARLEDISWREVGASTALQDVADSLKKWSFQKKYKRVSEKNVLSAIQEAIISYGKVRQEVKADWNYEEMRKFVGKKLQETNLEYDVRKIGNYINKVLWGQREEDCCKEVDTDTTKNVKAFVAHKKTAVIQKCKEKDKESAKDVWCVYSEKGKLMGRYKTEAEANKRLQQIHYFKQQGEKKDVDAYDVGTVDKKFYDSAKSSIGLKEKESGYISEDRTEGRPPTKDNLAGGSSEELMDAIVGDKEEKRSLSEEDLKILHDFRSIVKDRIRITPTENKYKTQFGYDVEYYNEEGNFEYGYGVQGFSNIEDAYSRLLDSLKEHNIIKSGEKIGEEEQHWVKEPNKLDYLREIGGEKMLKQIERFQREAKKLGRNGNSIEELKMYIRAQEEDWKAKIKKLINSASKENIYTWVSMQDLTEEFSDQLSNYSSDMESKEMILATPLSELHERFLGSWDDWTEDGYQFLLTHKG